jgi:hypothetical protein
MTIESTIVTRGSRMPNQSLRQMARRRALDAQIRVRQREEARDKRRRRLGVIVVTALAERDKQVGVLESRAAQALDDLIAREGLTVHEAAEWCDLATRDVRRLRRDFKKSVNDPDASQIPAPG